MKFLVQRLSVVLVGCLALFCQSAIVRADSPTTQPEKYIRFVDRGPAGGELDTADVAFTNGNGVTVHLVAAVHIGERAYYEQLAKGFESYDAVLYELIMPRDAAPPAGNGAGEQSTSVISGLQLFLKRALDLEFQLDLIDYTKSNYFNADLDKETFEKMQADRGESLLSLMIQQALSTWNNTPGAQVSDSNQEMADLVQILCRPDGQRQFKLLIASQMDDLEAQAAGLTGPDGSVILTERNKAAMRALSTALATGKKRIAIFYGAAHMPDMSQRLESLGFHPTGTDWHMAWDMTIRANQPSLAEQFIRGLMTTRNDGN